MLGIDDIAPVQIAAPQTLNQNFSRCDVGSEGDAVLVAETRDFVDKGIVLTAGSITEVRRQIGNAVPPEGVRLVARRLMPLFTGEYEKIDLEKEYEELRNLSVQERLERITNEME